MRKTNRAVVLYLTDSVHHKYHESLSPKDLCLVLYPARAEELKKIDNVRRSEVVHILMRMPIWWSDWYYRLPIEDRFRFAKVIEQRLKEYKLI
jgi:hypothetical protein